MKNKEFYKLLKKSYSKSNSGFTLTELLVGIIMAGIVVGGLGWGLLQILRVTQVGTSKSKVRSETSRAFTFISDEMRRAQSLEVDPDAARTAINARPGVSIPTDGTAVLALNIPNIPEKVIYYVADAPSDGVWRGPRVIYRWGPDFDANGNYSQNSIDDPTDPQNWSAQALIDKVDDVAQTVSCGGVDVDYTGFYACLVDDDGDGVVETADSNGDGLVIEENETVDSNGNGVLDLADTPVSDVNGDGVVDREDLDVNQDGNIDSEDNADQDGLTISAQLYFTGGTDAVGYSDDGNYAAETQVVARSRVAPNNNSDSFTSYTMSFKSLGAKYGCKESSDDWLMRTDFINNPATPDDQTGNNNAKWVHDPAEDSQPQPIRINTENNLIINSVPVSNGSSISDCISKGGSDSVDNIAYDNESLTENNESLYYHREDSNGNYIYTDGEGNDLPAGTKPIFKDNPAFDDDHIADGTIYHRVSHEIDFTDPVTYNGYTDGNNDIYVGNGSDSRVLFLRDGDTVPDNPGYDADNDAATTDNNQESLREFLIKQGYADASGQVQNIEKNERIVIFELGQTDTSQPGFDRQDNIFILSSDVFAKNAPTETP